MASVKMGFFGKENGMKTNQLMTVKLGRFGTVDIWHKTMMGRLNDVLEIGNAIRESKGLKPKTLHTYLRSKNTWELILKVYNEYLIEAKKDFGEFPKNSNSAILSEKSFLPIGKKVLYQETLDDLPQDGKKQIKYGEIAKTKVFESVFKIQDRGKFENRGTWANLFIILDLAQWLDVDLRYEIYKTFVEDKILILRDDGGEAFKRLNNLIDLLPDRIARAKEKSQPIAKSNKRVYSNIAKQVNAKVKGSFSKGWNSEDDMGEFQGRRKEILDMLTTALDMGFITSYIQLKSAIERYSFRGI